jgi:hypothetical protein
MVKKFYRQGRRCLKQYYSERLKQHPDCKCKTRKAFYGDKCTSLVHNTVYKGKKFYRQGCRCLKQYYSERLKQSLACKCKARREESLVANSLT